jgi:hypothetical protein
MDIGNNVHFQIYKNNVCKKSVITGMQSFLNFGKMAAYMVTLMINIKLS